MQKTGIKNIEKRVPSQEATVHPTAIIHPGAELDDGVIPIRASDRGHITTYGTARRGSRVKS